MTKLYYYIMKQELSTNSSGLHRESRLVTNIFIIVVMTDITHCEGTCTFDKQHARIADYATAWMTNQVTFHFIHFHFSRLIRTPD